MRTQHLAKLTAILPALAAGSQLAQGTFIYDQQSSTNETPANFGSGGDLMLNPPAQSFTPLLDSVGFIRLNFDDGNPGDGLGATVYVNLRAGSVTGTILGTSDSVTMRDGFAGVTNFLFPTPVSVSSGTTYFFEPVQSAGGNWNIEVGPYLYPGGILYVNGMPTQGADLWFREGIVPEPSPLSLVLIGGAALLGARARTPTRRTAT